MFIVLEHNKLDLYHVYSSRTHLVRFVSCL
jgi:hypothetical protein